jgi:hypothetical protein
MANLDEPIPTGNGSHGEEPIPLEKMSRLALETRVRELEKETTRLRSELTDSKAARKREREFLDAIILADLPRTEKEVKVWQENNTSFSELLRELEAEHGLEPPK